jgi:hypothetical protein
MDEAGERKAFDVSIAQRHEHGSGERHLESAAGGLQPR